MSWSVAARMCYAGFAGPAAERVRRAITVVSGASN